MARSGLRPGSHPHPHEHLTSSARWGALGGAIAIALLYGMASRRSGTSPLPNSPDRAASVSGDVKQSGQDEPAEPKKRETYDTASLRQGVPYWRLAILGSLALVLILVGMFTYVMMVHCTGPLARLLDPPCPALEQPATLMVLAATLPAEVAAFAAEASAFTYWSRVVLALLFSTAATCALAIQIYLSMRGHLKSTRRLFLTIVAGVLIGVVVAAGAVLSVTSGVHAMSDRLVAPTFQTMEINLLLIRVVAAGAPLFVMVVVPMAISLLVISHRADVDEVARAAVRSASENTGSAFTVNWAAMSSNVRQLERLLYLSAAASLAGIFGLNSYLQWPAGYVHSDLARSLESVASSFTTLSATFYTLYLLAVFGLGFAYIRSDAIRAARAVCSPYGNRVNEGKADHLIEKWLAEERGIAVSPLGRLAVLASILSPLLVGLPLAGLTAALSG